MSGYLLDTNIVSDLIRNPSGDAARRLAQLETQDIFTSIIVASELHYGCAKKDSPKLLARVKALLEIIQVLPLEVPSDLVYGQIRAELESLGQPISANDMLIAAHAQTLGLVLVTDNTQEFSRIPNLVLENWLARS